MLVGRSLEVSGDTYRRLMIEAQFIGNRTRLIGLHFLKYYASKSNGGPNPVRFPERDLLFCALIFIAL